MPDPALRAFIAIEIPASLRDPLAGLIARLRQAVPGQAARWVRAENIHLTLKFLGDMPVRQAGQVQAMIAGVAAEFAPFEVAAGGLGCFPNLRQPRVVWVGLRDATGALASLHLALEAGAARLGYPKEAGRGFSPHLTLARVGREAGPAEARRVGEAVQAAGPAELGALPVQALALMKSELRPGGSVYTRLHLARLAARNLTE